MVTLAVYDYLVMDLLLIVLEVVGSLFDELED